MNGWPVALLVALFFVIDLAVIGTVFAMCGAAIRPLVSAFPPVEPAHDAVRRRYQSFRFGMLNFGGCIHVAADERFLHLTPTWLARRFAVREMSVPWSEFKHAIVKGKWGKADLRGVNVRGPAWCMSLAAPRTETPAV